MVHQNNLVHIRLWWLEECRLRLIVGTVVEPLREHRHIPLADGAKNGAALHAYIRPCMSGSCFCGLDESGLVRLINLEDTQTRQSIPWREGKRVSLALFARRWYVVLHRCFSSF